MRARLRAAALLVGSAGIMAAALGATGAIAKSSAKKLHISCTATAYNVNFPKLSGTALAQLSCTKPFGSGVQLAHNTTSVVGSTVHVTGTFKNFFDDGTTFGKLTMSGPVGSGPITVTGSATITGGTGAYKHMKGTGPLTCTTRDGSKTFHCTVKGTGTL